MVTTTLTIRISPELKQELEYLAKADDRSLNNLINIALREFTKKNLPEKKDKD